MSTTPAITQCPYPGLRAFFTEERDWYFGREAHVDAMLTCLESNRFLAIVGSSGSGKSSLVFAGLIPALREGQLVGTRTDEQGEPAPWSVVCFHPGNQPLDELTGAIVEESQAAADPHLPGYVRAALASGDLIQALELAGLLHPACETLVYADQFEELFRFSEKSSRSAQENALRLSQLLVAAAEQKGKRLHILLSMRSEFIGECERFPGLPELVSRSQFLTPRLTRKQLEQSLGCPARAVGWEISPDALTALLNDCGNSPDQLPLAQHVLRRMWTRAAAANREELTLEDYTAVGGIRGSMAQHGDEILAKLPQPEGEEVARTLFMALCDQREEGPLVRRVSSAEEVAALAGGQSVLAPRVIAAFAGDDPGFIREDHDLLDVRHEAVLRQWPRIAEWRSREVESEAWLHELASAAADYEKTPPEGDLWTGRGLKRAEAWLLKEKPSDAWARRHGVKSWEQSLRFIASSRRARSSRQVAWVVAILAVLGLTVGPLWVTVRRSREAAAVAAEKRKELGMVLGNFANDLSGPITKNAIAAFAQEEQQTSQLINKIYAAAGLPPRRIAPSSLTTDAPASAPEPSAPAEESTASKEPPDAEDFEALADAREHADEAEKDLARLADSISRAAPVANDFNFAEKAQELARIIAKLKAGRLALQSNGEAKKAIEESLEALLSKTEKALAGLLGKSSLDPALVKEKDAALLAATADLEAIEGIHHAAHALGFAGEKGFVALAQRAESIEQTLALARRVMAAATVGDKVLKWTPEANAARTIEMGYKVSRVRFIATAASAEPLIGLAAGDGKKGSVRVVQLDGKMLGEGPTSSSLNDLTVSPKENAVAVASNGSTVRVLRWNGLNFDAAKTEAFSRHLDSITDVEYSHGGDRIASASADRTVRVFDSHSLAQLYFTSPPLPGAVTSVKFHPRDNLVVSGCDDGGVRLHAVDHPGVQLLGQLGAPARRPEFSADGKLVVAASGDKTARVWSISPVAEILKIDHTAPLTQATFRPVDDASGFTFITCANSGELRAVRVEGKNSTLSTHSLEPRHPAAVQSASWSDDGAWLASVGGGEVLVWKVSAPNPAPVAHLQISGLHAGTARAEFSPDARWLVTYGGDDRALLWDLAPLAIP